MSTDAAPVVVTPGGFSPQRWAGRIERAEAVTVDALADRLGLGSGSRSGPVTLVVCAAHPDDETLGAGRLVSCWSRQLGPVRALLATSGEACLDHVAARPSGLVERRLAEWRTALGLLGAEPVDPLGLPDGSVADHQQTLTDTIVRVLEDSQASAAAEAAGPVVVAAPWRGDPHPDHRAVGRAAAAAAAQTGAPLLEYPVWMTYWSDPDAEPARSATLLRMLCDQTAETAHHQACHAFDSQLLPLRTGLGPVVPPEMLAHQSRQLLLTGDVDHD